MRSQSVHSPNFGRSSKALTVETSSAIMQFLTVAERGYVRYYDLFTDTFYLKNPEKRKLAAKRYALLKASDELIQSKTYTKSEVFDTYQSFESASIKHYNSFLRKMKEFRELGSVSCTHGRIGQNYEYKMNPYTHALVFILYS